MNGCLACSLTGAKERSKSYPSKGNLPREKSVNKSSFPRAKVCSVTAANVYVPLSIIFSLTPFPRFLYVEQH